MTKMFERTPSASRAKPRLLKAMNQQPRRDCRRRWANNRECWRRWTNDQDERQQQPQPTTTEVWKTPQREQIWLRINPKVAEGPSIWWNQQNSKNWPESVWIGLIPAWNRREPAWTGPVSAWTGRYRCKPDWTGRNGEETAWKWVNVTEMRGAGMDHDRKMRESTRSRYPRESREIRDHQWYLREICHRWDRERSESHRWDRKRSESLGERSRAPAIWESRDQDPSTTWDDQLRERTKIKVENHRRSKRATKNRERTIENH